MMTVKDIVTQNKKEEDVYFIHLIHRSDDPMSAELWSGWLKDIPEEYMEYEVLETAQSLRDLENGIIGFFLEIRGVSKAAESKYMSKKEMQRLYELLEKVKNADEKAALRHAVFILENSILEYLKEEYSEQKPAEHAEQTGAYAEFWKRLYEYTGRNG